MGAAKKRSTAATAWEDGGCFSTIRGARRNIVVQEVGTEREVTRVADAKDAAIIIAAPELLEALEEAATQLVRAYGNPPSALEDVNDGHRALEAARKVIAKARGES